MTPCKLVLAAALLVLAPVTAVASVPRQRAADVLAATSLERSLAAEKSSPFALDDVSLAPRSREGGFRVFAGDELGDAHVLVFELRYPETRVRGLGLPDETRVWAERSLRLEAPWACDGCSGGKASGSGEFRIFDAAGSSRSASAFGWNRLFQGREHLGVVDAYDFRARILWPELGRFGQEDPAGPVDSPNRYQSFLGNWPNTIDPLGLDTILVFSGSPRDATDRPDHDVGRGFEIAAQRKATELEQAEASKPAGVKKDVVFSASVWTKAEFLTYMTFPWPSGPIRQVHIFSHAFEHGVNFGGAPAGGDGRKIRNFTVADIPLIKNVKFSENGEFLLYGCNTASRPPEGYYPMNFVEDIARVLGLRATGNSCGAHFVENDLVPQLPGRIVTITPPGWPRKTPAAPRPTVPTPEDLR